MLYPKSLMDSELYYVDVQASLQFTPSGGRGTQGVERAPRSQFPLWPLPVSSKQALV